MRQADDLLAKLRGLNQAIAEQDPKLHQEGRAAPTAEVESVRPAGVQGAIQTESIVLKRLRPVLAIKNNTTDLTFSDQSDSALWKDRLGRAKDKLDPVISAVGRVELEGGSLDWVGTGWLVAENILVTNRHVANEFASRDGQGFKFQMGDLGPISARTDFLQEIGNTDILAFNLIKPLYIEDELGPDISFFEIEMTRGDKNLARPVDLATTIVETSGVATIGYPAYDSRIPDPDLMKKLYGNIYDKKRLAPGAVTKVEGTRLLHNCTTLGGNSGSVVVDLDTGKAIGLHFSGTFLTTNYAVRADVVDDLLRRVQSGRVRRTSSGEAVPLSAEPPRASSPTPISLATASITIPLTISFSLGNPSDTASHLVPTRPAPPDLAAAADASEDIAPEGRVEDYRDREGYKEDFLEGVTVPLPVVRRDADDVLEFDSDGESEHVLKYEHYSVVMSSARRMCFFSAVNIDGNLSKKSGRAGWKWDPRIPKTQQIMQECYGSPPKFSRGHMTRREDPGWGRDMKTAKRGNEDSMHVTNTTPQMQAFNAPIWLALEDYALQHAREDKMKICVFTGPFFGKRDPKMYGVKIPLAFWKIIAFIHDKTGKLCATGYAMDQTKTLQPEEEFVFGAFKSPQLNKATQVSIRSIETRSGLSFGTLAMFDPLAAETESTEGGQPALALQRLEQIRFVS